IPCSGPPQAVRFLQASSVPGVGARLGVDKNALAILNANLVPLPTSPFGCNFSLPNIDPNFPQLDPRDPNHCYTAAISPSTYWREEQFCIDHLITPRVKGSFFFLHDAWGRKMLEPQWGNPRMSNPAPGTLPPLHTPFGGPS